MALQIETASLNFREIYHDRSTMGQILNQRDRDPLGLLDIDAEITSFDTPSTSLYSVLLNDSFYGYKLIQLLTNARPQEERPYNQGEDAILADWEMPDNNAEYASRLVSLHQSDSQLGQHWLEFERHHRHKFIRALKARPSEVETSINRIVQGHFIDEVQASVRLANFLKQNVRSRQRPYLFQDYRPLVEWLESRNQNIPRHALRNMSKKRTDKFVDGVINNLPEELIIRMLKDGFLGSHIVLNAQQSSSFYLYNPLGNSSEYSIEFLPSGPVKITYMNASVTGDFTKDGFRELERSVPLHPDVLIPLLIWAKSKNTGERTYISSQIPSSVTTINKANPLLGLIVATYLSPEQRDALPRRLGLKGGRYQQLMAEAQIPLLVSMYRGSILQSRVFQRVEEYTGTLTMV